MGLETFVEDSALTLRGKNNAMPRRKTAAPRGQRPSFERRIGPPRGIERDKIATGFRNGALTATLPRTKAAQQPRLEFLLTAPPAKGGVRIFDSGRSPTTTRRLPSRV